MHLCVSWYLLSVRAGSIEPRSLFLAVVLACGGKTVLKFLLFMCLVLTFCATTPWTWGHDKDNVYSDMSGS